MRRRGSEVASTASVNADSERRRANVGSAFTDWLPSHNGAGNVWRDTLEAGELGTMPTKYSYHTIHESCLREPPVCFKRRCSHSSRLRISSLETVGLEQYLLVISVNDNIVVRLRSESKGVPSATVF